MRILITGGLGFVGRRFARRLLEKDEHEQVVIVDNMLAGLPVDQWMFKPRFAERLTVKQDDIRNVIRSKQFTPDQFDLIIHCAAVVGGRLNIQYDPLAVATNLSIDSEFFNWVTRVVTLPRVVYFSSSAVYPLVAQRKHNWRRLREGELEYDDGIVCMPDMTYGWSKLSGEYLAKIACENYGLDVKVYRPFGGYGEDQDFSYPVPAILQRVSRGDDPVVVWGSGEQLRDFVYIEDVISIVLHTLNIRLLPPLNIGTGIGVSFADLAKIAGIITKREFKIECDASKPEGVFARVAETTRLAAYYPKTLLPLSEGLAKVMKWATEKVQ